MSKGDFLVRVAGQRTTFEARSIAAEEWLRASGRITAGAAHPYIIERDGHGASIFLEALNRKGFVCCYDDGATVERKVDPPRDPKPALYGCGIIAALLVLAPRLHLVNRCSSAAPVKPTPSELDEERYYAKRAAERNQFEAQQAPLWKLPGSALNAENLRIELAKCREAINPPNVPEAYLTESDEGEALRNARSYGLITIMGQRTNPFGSVELIKFTCHFRGAGFENVSSQSAGTMKHFIPDY